MLVSKEAQSGVCPKNVAAKHLQDREKEWANLVNKPEPLQLLDLPMDILQAIIKEITHTNDLTSLALTHSVLHALVTPHIYSRFDIVWPDGGPAIESRVGVDALTYGLATLVMAQDVFGEGVYQRTNTPCAECGCLDFCQHRVAPIRSCKPRRGNHFAQFTRKFSLGNGPEDWVKEYLITKEGGKMLGTLVALAVGRMRNLESFTWDMPTGVLRDVWLALASLEGRDDGHECRLERVWVRWHDNQDTLTSPPLPGAPTGLPDLPRLIAGTGRPSFQIPPYPRVEFPTFSVLPPLKSLGVLDIDELSYVEEMSVLIERSLSRLTELRVSLAHHAQGRLWARPKEDRSIVPPQLPRASEQAPRPGGLMGILVSRFCQTLSGTAINQDATADAVAGSDSTQANLTSLKDASEVKIDESEPNQGEDDIDQLRVLFSGQNLAEAKSLNAEAIPSTDAQADQLAIPAVARPTIQAFSDVSQDGQRRLRLEILELERLYLSMPVLSFAFDWSRLRTLTILSCRDHEQLWKTLRKNFTPSSHCRTSSFSKSATPGDLRFGRRSISDSPSSSAAEYRLRITRLHTDTVSAALLAFVKDTLAPDTLEHLFLQQSSAYKSNVTIEQIYKHAVRRHRGSLKKLLIDSDVRGADGSPDGGSHWRKWAVSRELITCITSGRMQLRELSMSIDYKDWHYFLQRLPEASTLRSLHISHIADYVHNRIDSREAALQILDIVSLKPELELCYVAIQGKCYEILEYPSNRKLPLTMHDASDLMPSPHVDDDDMSDDHDDQDHNGNDDASEDLDLLTDHEDIEETDDEALLDGTRIALKLREILFYDDKISIFKARHGRL